jgi:hypothetical protein
MAYIEYVSVGQTTVDLLPVLAKANYFTLADLRQNRNGRISGTQMARMASKALRPMIYVIGASLMWAAFLLVLSKLSPYVQFRIFRMLGSEGPMLVLGVLGCLGAIVTTIVKTGRLTLGLLLDVATGRAAVLEGRVHPSREGFVELGVQLFRPRTADSEYDPSTPMRYHYVIQNEYFEVDLPAFEALAPRTNYRLYFGPHSKLLLSVEPLGASVPPPAEG